MPFDLSPDWFIFVPNVALALVISISHSTLDELALETPILRMEFCDASMSTPVF